MNRSQKSVIFVKLEDMNAMSCHAIYKNFLNNLLLHTYICKHTYMYTYDIKIYYILGNTKVWNEKDN